MIRLEPVCQAAKEFAHGRGKWPWTVIGVFPTVDDVASDPEAKHTGFLYTVGLGPLYEVWMPAVSIEGRHAGFDLCNMIVNTIAFGTTDHVVKPGDDAAMGLGIPNAQGEWDHDEDAIFWIGQVEPAGRRQTFQSDAPFTLPVLWSSPLGWAD